MPRATVSLVTTGGLWREWGSGAGRSSEHALPYSSGQRAVGVGFRSAGTEETASWSRWLKILYCSLLACRFPLSFCDLCTLEVNVSKQTALIKWPAAFKGGKVWLTLQQSTFFFYLGFEWKLPVRYSGLCNHIYGTALLNLNKPMAKAV